MARLDEIAEGLAAVLASSPYPEPLALTFKSHSPVDMTFLVRSVIAACDRQGRPLAYVRVPESVATILGRDPDRDATGCVRVVCNTAGSSAIEFGRFPDGS